VIQEIVPGDISVSEATVSQTLRTISFSRSQLDGKIRESLENVEPEKRFLYDLADVQFEITEWEDHSARLKVTIPVRFFSPLAPENFRTEAFSGLSERAVLRLLREQQGITEATVNYSPRWLKWLLARFGAVTITLLEP